ncbi:MAG TPA: hypothetical protein VK714_20505 [Myxococcota bacterium]|nr:hypothetical protein [Myxococcota bacterium]
MPEFPADILSAMEKGQVLSVDQFHRLIAVEAQAIGLTFDQALELARRRALPQGPIGTDLGLLIEMLPAA